MAFILGKTHTSDECYRKALELKEERDLAIANAKASQLKDKAKRLRNAIEQKAAEDANDEPRLLEAQAELMEMEAFVEQGKSCFEEAVRESAFIQTLLDKIEPHRKYGHLPLHEANQACQMEEWKEELKWRADNFLLSQGSIPHDHFETMRIHPQWESEIQPIIEHKIHAIKMSQLDGGKTSVPMLVHKEPVPEIKEEFERFLLLEQESVAKLEDKS